MRQRASSLGLLLALALASPPALGQTAPPPKPRASLSESLSGPAKDAFASAQVLVNNNDFSGAFTKYEQAYKLSKDPRLLFNMAICARGLHAYAKMQALLLRYQRESGPNMSAQDKVDVSGALGVIRTLVGSVKLTVSEPGATVAVDGQVAGTTPLSEPLVIDLGAHTIAVAKPDFDPVERKVQIVGGAEVPLAVTLSARMSGEGDDGDDDGLTLLSPTRARVEVRVADTGIGIPDREKPKVFDAFYQVDSSSTREYGGTGLGLSIVKRLVEAHSGTIVIEDNEPRGTVFVVSLPQAAPVDAPPIS